MPLVPAVASSHLEFVWVPNDRFDANEQLNVFSTLSGFLDLDVRVRVVYGDPLTGDLYLSKAHRSSSRPTEGYVKHVWSNANEIGLRRTKKDYYVGPVPIENVMLITETRSGRVLYKHPNYVPPVVKVMATKDVPDKDVSDWYRDFRYCVVAGTFSTHSAYAGITHNARTAINRAKVWAKYFATTWTYEVGDDQ
jgi:hypothetical protein